MFVELFGFKGKFNSSDNFSGVDIFVGVHNEYIIIESVRNKAFNSAQN